MSYILIDGYNLIGTVKKNMEKEREALIDRLFTFTGVRPHSITLVFDGWKEGLPVESRTKKGNVTIIYSRLNETADSVIKRIISEKKRTWIVVSSDREIMRTAQKFDCFYLTSREFSRKVQEVMNIERGNLFHSSDEPEEDEEYIPQRPRKKGNPRRLSKKERKKHKAIKKL